MEIEIDSRCHNRIIGPRGKSVRKLMEQFKVDIRFPKGEQDKCVVTGLEENCESCKEHLLMLEEEYVSLFFFLYTIIHGLKHSNICCFFKSYLL